MDTLRECALFYNCVSTIHTRYKLYCTVYIYDIVSLRLCIVTREFRASGFVANYSRRRVRCIDLQKPIARS